MTARDSHSDSTQTWFRDRSNEIDDLSKILASRSTRAGTPVASSTATRISTIGPSQVGSLIADRAVEVGWNMLQPALLRVDCWRLACSDPPVLDCAEGYGRERLGTYQGTVKPTDRA